VGVDGRVLGVNTAAIRHAGGIGFAIPADIVGDIVSELIADGAVERATLGVSVAPHRAGDHDQTERLVVTAVRANATGPFAEGDVLLGIAEHDVHSQQDLFRLLRRDMINTSVAVHVTRHGRPTSFHCRPRRLT
jgi:serine protease Do